MTILFASEKATGISSLGLDVKAFIFQLITFVIIMWLLNKFALRKIFATIEARRTEIDQSLNNVDEAKRALEEADEKASQILQAARTAADEVAADAHKEAAEVVKEAEAKAGQKVERMLAESREQLNQDVEKARTQLKAEAASLVAAATATVLDEKLTDSKDKELIARSLNEASK